MAPSNCLILKLIILVCCKFYLNYESNDIGFINKRNAHYISESHSRYRPNLISTTFMIVCNTRLTYENSERSIDIFNNVTLIWKQSWVKWIRLISIYITRNLMTNVWCIILLAISDPVARSGTIFKLIAMWDVWLFLAMMLWIFLVENYE